MVRCLVFIHGWASNPEIWFRQKEYFGKNYEVVLPDISAAKDIKEAAGIVGILIKDKKDFILVGWSLGWMVVLELLKSFNISPRGLVAVNSCVKFADDGYLGAGPQPGHLSKMIRDCKRSPQKTLEEFYKSILTNTGKNMLNKIRLRGLKYDKLIYGLYILRDCDYRDFIKEINQPVLLIAGLNDNICHRRASEYMHKIIPHSQLKVFDCGHIPFIDRANEFSGAVEDFIRGLGR
jgi:pimeloyl-[acyl-carrier protein] methyl ester esterase